MSIKYILPFLLSGLLISCASSKEATVPKQMDVQDYKEQTGELPAYKQMEFDRHFFEGLKEKMDGNHTKAASAFERALSIDPSNAAAHYELGRIYSLLKRIKDAENEVKLAIKYDSENKWYKLLLADVYQYQEKYTEASEIYIELVNKYPEEPDYYFQLAAMQLYLNKPFEAVKTYDRFEKQFGITEEVIIHKHRIYIETGKNDKAIEEANKLIKWDANNREYYQLLAETYLHSGDEAKAMEVYNTLLQKYPDDGAVQMGMADYYLRKGDKERGMELMKKAFNSPAVDVDKKIQILYSRYLMRNAISEEEQQEGFELAEALVEAHPEEAKTHAIYGDFLYNADKFKEARVEYRESLKYRQDVFSVWQQLFFIESALRDFKAMEEESEKAMTYFPNQPLVYFFNGVSKLEQKKYSESEEMLLSGVNMIIDNPSLQTQFYINLGEAAHRQHKYTESDSYFEKALELDGNNNLALNNYAYYLSLRNHDLEKAERMSKKTLVTEPDNASYLDTYGWILYKLEKYDEAEKYIKQSLEQEPLAAEVLEHYGDVLYKLGREREAIEYWNKAKAQGTGYSEVLDKKIAEKKLHE